MSEDRIDVENEEVLETNEIEDDNFEIEEKVEENQNDIICFFLQIIGQLKTLHWQTQSYSRHMAYERIYDEIEDFIDNFIEVYQGKYGRLRIESHIVLKNIDDEGLNTFINDSIDTLKSLVDENESDMSLINIRDEMIGKFNLLKYLLTLQ